MALVAVGVSFNEISLPELEFIERHVEQIRAAIFDDPLNREVILGGVILATCNRFEVYLESHRVREAVATVVEVVCRTTGWDYEYASETLRAMYGTPAVNHLFSVASGLNSMVVGETEIAGQVRESYRSAQDSGSSSSIIDLAFQMAARVSKKVATESGLAETSRSLASVGLEIAERHQKLIGKKALVVGTGAYARIVVSQLLQRGVSEIWVYSNSGRANDFAASLSISAINLQELPGTIGSVDIVVAASGTGHRLLDLELLTKAGITERENPLQIVDLALASDVAPEIGGLVELINLEVISQNVPEQQISAVRLAESYVQQQVVEFENRLQSRFVEPAVLALRAYVEQAVRDEVSRVRGKSGAEAALAVEKSLNRLANNILHAPSVRARELAILGSDDDYRDAVNLLFGLDVSAVERA